MTRHMIEWFRWRAIEHSSSEPGLKYCDRCGAPNEPTAPYCGACGQKLPY